MAVLAFGVAGCRDAFEVECDGVLADGELCDDGDGDEYDGCDCAARLIPLAPTPAAVPTAPVVLAEDGAWCWFQDERAIIVGEHLLAASISHGGDVQVASYDLSTGARAQTLLHSRLERDDHDAPSLLALPDGRVAAFFTRHDGFPHLYTHVGAPGAEGAWAPQRRFSFDYDVTYTNPFLSASEPGRIELFLRGYGVDPMLVATTDDGASWSRGGKLMDAGGLLMSHRPYVKFASDGDAIHLVYTDGHPNEFLRNSVYHLVYRGGAVWRSDGTRVAAVSPSSGPELEPGAGTRIYDGTVLPGGQAWTWDVALDDGRPVAVFSTYPDPARPYYDHRYRYARWDGEAWQVSVIAYAGTGIYFAEGFYSGGISLDPDNPDVVYFASNVDPVTGEPAASPFFEIYRGVTTDAGATWTFSAVTTASTADNLRPVVPAGHAAATTVLWMQGSYESYVDFHTRIVALVGDAAAVATTTPVAELGLEAIARFDLASTQAGPASPTAPGFVAAIPAAGTAMAEDRGVTLEVRNITGSRDSGIGDLLHRDRVVCDRGGSSPDDKLTVTLGGLDAGADYLVRLHGHDTADAYLEPTLWFRGDATSLSPDRNEALVGAHRNVNGTSAGAGAVELFVTADAAGEVRLVARGLDDIGGDTTAVLAGVEVLERPVTTVVARFDVDAEPGVGTAEGAASLSWDHAWAWSGTAVDGGITATVTSDRILALRRRDHDDDLLADFAFGRDQLVVDLDGLEPGRLYELTIHSTDVDQNLHDTTRWRIEEPGGAPLDVRTYHANHRLAGAGASFTFLHRASATSLRLRGEDVMTSESTEPSLVFLNGLDVRVAP